ncbi:hypothetical protein BDN67DRAFT_758860 [Paxillus ammoniavirescens]|nr:hypothetical protein BDN67DRAFT_758860 [Paxillus ammoniavirescens]
MAIQRGHVSVVEYLLSVRVLLPPDILLTAATAQRGHAHWQRCKCPHTVLTSRGVSVLHLSTRNVLWNGVDMWWHALRTHGRDPFLLVQLAEGSRGGYFSHELVHRRNGVFHCGAEPLTAGRVCASSPSIHAGLVGYEDRVLVCSIMRFSSETAHFCALKTQVWWTRIQVH